MIIFVPISSARRLSAIYIRLTKIKIDLSWSTSIHSAPTDNLNDGIDIAMRREAAKLCKEKWMYWPLKRKDDKNNNKEDLRIMFHELFLIDTMSWIKKNAKAGFIFISFRPLFHSRFHIFKV